jgi:hypothetical protein
MNWNTTRTGKIFHSFTGGVAVCSSRIKATGTGPGFESLIDAEGHCWELAYDVTKADESVCKKCTELEERATARLEASMQPSTGEGDYLPPAEAADAVFDDLRREAETQWSSKFIGIMQALCESDLAAKVGFLLPADDTDNGAQDPAAEAADVDAAIHTDARLSWDLTGRACQAPEALGGFGRRIGGSCDQPATEYRPDRMYVRYICARHR